MKKIPKILAAILAILLFAVTFTSCGEDNVDYSKVDNPIATIIVKDFGTITAELYPAVAPETVKNFIYLSNSGFYDGLIFHRITKSPIYVIQGGDPKGNGTGGPGYTIKGEFTMNGVVNNVSHVKGALSMARSTDYDSAGSQFFIVYKNSTSLDRQYATFGMITDGMDVAETIAKVETNKSSKPFTDVVIESIRVDTKGVTYGEPNKIKE